jgi:hypothetical protein
MKKSVTLITVGLCLMVNQAHATIFVCTDSEGTKTYQNVGNSKGCRILPESKTSGSGKISDFSSFSKTDNQAMTRGTVRVPKGVIENQGESSRKRILQQELKQASDRLDSLRIKKERNDSRLTDSETVELRQLESDVRALNREIETTP